MLEINNLTVGEVKEIQSIFGGNQKQNIHAGFIGKVCVVRTYSAGVHIGTVEQITDTNVLLSNARRLWKWSGAFTLSEVATGGVSDSSRIAVAVEKILLTQAIEIIPTTEKARESYDECSE